MTGKVPVPFDDIVTARSTLQRARNSASAILAMPEYDDENPQDVITDVLHLLRERLGNDEAVRERLDMALHNYDAEQLAELRREWAMEQNLTVAQLAEVVGRSRHAIAGLVRRRGIAPVGHAIEAGKSVALYPARSVIEAARPESA